MTTLISLPAHALTRLETTPFTALTTSLRASLATAPELGQTANQQVCAEAARLGLPILEPAQWLYTGISGHPDDEFDLTIALPVALMEPVTPSTPFTIQSIPSFRCAQYTYTGAWTDLFEVYNALFRQFYAADWVYDGRVREVYRVIDMENPDNCVTEIQLGIA